MNKRQPTQNMQNMYDAKRNDTLNRIKNAIHTMKEWDEPVTRSKIMEMANVSSGTLSKPYVIELLKEERVLQFAAVDIHDKVKEYYEGKISDIISENKALKKKIDKQSARISALDKQKSSLDAELMKYKETNMRLRGQNQMLLERLDNMGVPVTNIRLIK